MLPFALLKKTDPTHGAFCSPWHSEKNITMLHRIQKEVFDRLLTDHFPWQLQNVSAWCSGKKFWGFVSLSVFFFFLIFNNVAWMWKGAEFTTKSPLRCSPFCSGGRRPWDSALRGDTVLPTPHHPHLRVPPAWNIKWQILFIFSFYVVDLSCTGDMLGNHSSLRKETLLLCVVVLAPMKIILDRISQVRGRSRHAGNKRSGWMLFNIWYPIITSIIFE